MYYAKIIIITIMLQSTDQKVEVNYDLPIGKTKQGLDIYRIDPKFQQGCDLSQNIHQELKEGRYVRQFLIEKGVDRRVFVQDNHIFPYHSMGLLYSQFDYVDIFGDNTCYSGHGTATLVAPNVILTCAHNICCKDHKAQVIYRASRSWFFPGRRGQLALGKYKVKMPYLYPIQFEDGWNINVDKKYDWAFLVLEDSIDFLIPIPMIVDYRQSQCKISIYGYSKQKQDKNLSIWQEKNRKINQRKIQKLYGMTDKNYKILTDTNLIEHYLDTLSGQSGSAIIVNQKDGVIGAIGVHTTGYCSQQSGQVTNYGNRLTLDKYNLAQTWMLQEHGQKIGAIPRVVRGPQIMKTIAFVITLILVLTVDCWI